MVTIPAGVKHWHGAQADSWFSHIAVEIPGAETSNEWLEPVSDEAYSQLPTTKGKGIDRGEAKYATKKAFRKANMFGMGNRYLSARPERVGTRQKEKRPLVYMKGLWCVFQPE